MIFLKNDLKRDCQEESEAYMIYALQPPQSLVTSAPVFRDHVPGMREAGGHLHLRLRARAVADFSREFFPMPVLQCYISGSLKLAPVCTCTYEDTLT